MSGNLKVTPMGQGYANAPKRSRCQSEMYLRHSGRRSLRRRWSLFHRLVTCPCRKRTGIHQVVTRSLVQASLWDLAAQIGDQRYRSLDPGKGLDVKVAYHLGW